MEYTSKPLFICLYSQAFGQINCFLGRPRGDKRTESRGVCNGTALVSYPNITFTCPLFLHNLLNRIVQGKMGTNDLPSTPEEVGCGAAPGSGLSESACCARCRCRELSVPSPAVVAPLAAAATAAPVPVSGMLSISEERRKMKIFSGKLSNGIASQEEGRAWVKRGGRWGSD